MKNHIPNWDLSDLYSSVGDPKIGADMEGAFRAAHNFQKKYKGKVVKLRSARELLKITKEYEKIIQEAELPAVYAEIVFTVKSGDEKIGALVQKTRTGLINVNKELTFFELEILKIPVDVLAKIIKDPQLKNYAHFFKKLLKERPHRLSEAEEKILSDTLLTGELAFTRLFDNILGTKKYQIDGKTLSEAEILGLLYSAYDRNTRKKAALTFTKGLEESLSTLTFIFNILSQDKEIRDKYRRFPDPEAARHLDNEISQKAVDALASTATRNYKLVGDFYRFKKEVLGYQNLYDYDRYAPTAESKTIIPFKQAKEIILKAFHKFSSEYAALAQEFFDKKWIDAKPKKGKIGGAYCNYVAPNLHPYIFINYTGTVRDVLTLAHELGHGVQAMLARRQTRLNFDWPLTVAETASIFSEMIVFDYLRKEVKNEKDLFSLYMGEIESIFATVFRQVSMHLFEKDFHRIRKEQGELSAKDISNIWLKRQKEMFGNSVELTKEYGIWWGYVSHFVFAPFYVYAYAFGELLTLSLYAKYKKNGPIFLKKFTAMLAAGGSKSPQELMSPLGINLDDPNFWQEGIELIEELIKEAKFLHK